MRGPDVSSNVEANLPSPEMDQSHAGPNQDGYQGAELLFRAAFRSTGGWKVMPRSIHPLSRRAVLLSLASGAAWHGPSGGSVAPANRNKINCSGPRTDGTSVSVNGAARGERSQFVVSSLEIGRRLCEAWGGDEFGYSYTYTLAGQPNGVSIDTETGILSSSRHSALARIVLRSASRTREPQRKLRDSPAHYLCGRA